MNKSPQIRFQQDFSRILLLLTCLSILSYLFDFLVFQDIFDKFIIRNLCISIIIYQWCNETVNIRLNGTRCVYFVIYITLDKYRYKNIIFFFLINDIINYN